MEITMINVNPFSPDSAKSNIGKFSKITNWVKLKYKQLYSKVLLNSFPMNGHILGLCPQNQKLENFVSTEVSLWESKGYRDQTNGRKTQVVKIKAMFKI